MTSHLALYAVACFSFAEHESHFPRYSFDPRDLLLKIITVLLRISRGACPRKSLSQEVRIKEIDECLALDPDYCKSTMEQALRVLRRECIGSPEMVEELDTLVRKVSVCVCVWRSGWQSFCVYGSFGLSFSHCPHC